MKQYDKIGQKYIENHSTSLNLKNDWARAYIRKNVKGSKILDLGCGNGQDVEFFELKGITAYGIDESKFMIDQSKSSKKGSLLVHDMSKTLPFSSNSFDCIYARFSLHYLESLDYIFKEINRLLKKGGRLVIVSPHPFADFEDKGSKDYFKTQKITVKLFFGTVKVNYFSHTMKDYLSNNNLKLFELVEIEEFLEKHRTSKTGVPSAMGLVFRKK